jgi:adenine deaminase
MMLTSDGSSPPMMRHGFMDYTIRQAIEAGVPAIDAYVMATLQPAVYYGLDGEVGGIAPGRIADLLFLRTPENPTPELVIANGRREQQGGQLLNTLPAIDWTRYSFPAINQKLEQIDLSWFQIKHPGEKLPVIRMINAVISTLEWEELPADEYGYVSISHDPELAFIVLLDPEGNRMTQALVRGYGNDLEAVATTYTASSDWLAIGRNPSAMTTAMWKVKEMGGGIAMSDKGKIVFEMPLPLAGKMTDLPMEKVISLGEQYTSLLREKGHIHLDPIYSLLFFTATHLPFVRLTAEGIIDVKESKVILPSIKL